MRSILASHRFIPPTEVIVGRLHDPQQRSRDRLFNYTGGGLRLFPIRWSANGDRLYVRVRENEERVVAFTADGAPVAEIARLDASWDRIDLNAISHGDVDLLTDPATIARTRRIRSSTLIRGGATLGRTLELLGARRSDLEMVRVGADGETPVGLSASQTQMLTAFPDDRDYPAGVSYLGAPIRGTRQYLPYQLPVVDLASGRVVGAAGGMGVTLLRPGPLRRSLDRFRRMQAERGLVVLDASYSAGAMAVLTISGLGDRKLFRLGASGISEQPLCAAFTPGARRTGPLPLASDSSHRQRTRIFALDRNGRETMAPGRPILTVRQVGDEPTREAVIYFHGGPGGTAVDDHVSVQLRRLLTPHRDVVFVEYSGSQGGGIELTRRLPRLGIRAIEEDVDDIVRWLGRQGYSRTFVIGTSFGGVPAMAAVARHGELFPAAFFVVPLLRYRLPEEWVSVGTSGNGPVMADTQLARDRVYYGGEVGQQRFGTDLQALVANGRLGPSHHFFFAARDPVSTAADLPVGIISPRQVLPGIHATVATSDEVWDEIVGRMQAEPTRN